LFLFAGNRIMKIVRLVRVMPEVFAQSPDQMPDTRHEECYQDRSSNQTKRLPQWRFDHRHEKRRKKERDSCEDRPLPLMILASIILQNLIDDPVPARLSRDVAGALCVRIIRSENRTSTLASVQLSIVKSALLRIDQRVISQRQHREFPGRLLRASIDIR